MTKARKIISMIMTFVILCGLFVACQPAPAEDPATLASTPSSSIAPPPSSIPPTVPTTQPTQPTTQPTEPVPTTPNVSTGYSYIHTEYGSSIWDKYDLSNCVLGYLYWLDKDTHTVTLLLAEELEHEVTEGEHIYFVKKAEPSKIYRMCIAAPEQYELVYETTYGAITSIYINYTMRNYLQYVTDSKKCIIYEMNSGEETVMMEQYKIDSIYIQKESGNILPDWILFYGQPTEDSLYGEYAYNRTTGEIEVVHDDCNCGECI